MVASPARSVVVSAYGERTSRTSVSASGRRYSPVRRSGALSNFEPRTSTKGVRAGTGRAIFARIQSASTGDSAGAAKVAALASVSSSAGASRLAQVLEGGVVRCIVALPEIVEVEP